MSAIAENTVPSLKVCHAVPGEMDTMKMRGFNGPTNGALPVEHTDGSRLLDMIAADHTHGHAQRVAAAQAAAATLESAD
jgi:hypothetical protein